MKKLFFLICMTACCVTFAQWHTWEKPPKKDQLYMTFHICLDKKIKNKQILVVSRYDGKNSIRQFEEDGWWEVYPYDILKWFNEKVNVIYLPNGIDDDFIKVVKSLAQY